MSDKRHEHTHDGPSIVPTHATADTLRLDSTGDAVTVDAPTVGREMPGDPPMAPDDRPANLPAIVAMAEVNIRALTDDAVRGLAWDARPAVRRVAHEELTRRGIPLPYSTLYTREPIVLDVPVNDPTFDPATEEVIQYPGEPFPRIRPKGR